MDNSKPCKKCQRLLPLTDFHKNSNISDGHKNSCKACESRLYAEYRAKKPRNVTVEQQQKWNQARKAKYTESDLRSMKRVYYQNNKPMFRESRKRYLAKNPGLNAAYVRKYEAIKRGNGVFLVTKKEVANLVQGCCFYCKCNSTKLTLDHVIPLSRGGTHSIGNLVGACGSCNSSKGNKFITEWKREKNNAAY
jgi:5-methylcytosine-specific restriction endonuclease McrA